MVNNPACLPAAAFAGDGFDQYLAQPDEGSHDHDVHLHSALAVQDRGKHGHTQLGECLGKVAPATAAHSASPFLS